MILFFGTIIPIVQPIEKSMSVKRNPKLVTEKWKRCHLQKAWKFFNKSSFSIPLKILKVIAIVAAENVEKWNNWKSVNRNKKRAYKFQGLMKNQQIQCKLKVFLQTHTFSNNSRHCKKHRHRKSFNIFPCTISLFLNRNHQDSCSRCKTHCPLFLFIFKNHPAQFYIIFPRGNVFPLESSA